MSTCHRGCVLYHESEKNTSNNSHLGLPHSVFLLLYFIFSLALVVLWEAILTMNSLFVSSIYAIPLDPPPPSHATPCYWTLNSRTLFQRTVNYLCLVGNSWDETIFQWETFFVCVYVCERVTHLPSHATQGQIGFCIVVPLALVFVNIITHRTA